MVVAAIEPDILACSYHPRTQEVRLEQYVFGLTFRKRDLSSELQKEACTRAGGHEPGCHRRLEESVNNWGEYFVISERKRTSVFSPALDV